VKILPGDSLTLGKLLYSTMNVRLQSEAKYLTNYCKSNSLNSDLECTYDTTWKKGLATTGGRSPREEMCQTFLMYYPKTLEVNQCGSNFPQQTMLDFMGIEEVSKYACFLHLSKVFQFQLIVISFDSFREQGVIDPTVLSPAHLAGMKYSQVVEAIDWTPEKRQVFQNLTRYSLHEAYCSPFDEVSGEPFGSVTYPTYNAPYEPPNPCKA